VPVLVLGLTYRDGVAELAYSRALPLIERLIGRGADVSAYDPLIDGDEIQRLGARPYRWGERGPFRAIVAQTGDPLFRELDLSLFGELNLLYDGRNSLRQLSLPPGVTYLGVGVREASPGGWSRRPATRP